MKRNILLEKSFDFAVEVVQLHKILRFEEKEFILSKQLLRSATSIGANAEEAVGGASRKDFRARLRISYKEARETKYWLKLLYKTDYLNRDQFDSLYQKCDELCRLLYSSIMSSK